MHAVAVVRGRTSLLGWGSDGGGGPRKDDLGLKHGGNGAERFDGLVRCMGYSWKTEGGGVVLEV